MGKNGVAVKKAEELSKSYSCVPRLDDDPTYADDLNTMRMSKDYDNSIAPALTRQMPCLGM